ncbi:Zn-ribbon domain-containing OB-fold protein [Sneathiella glossodoripedis]|uniref:Zn-ribbon domain-containing OB-fold protein n=1 Tax=Sneathiella glossodoripedis TaxID=418853 RepID=UPI00046F50F0|nr:OB-fold domain-containing protein [Sneathiella glossodoripedis]
MTEQKIFPAPSVDPETKEFWAATNENKLLVRYCNSCESYHHYPRTICPHCGSDDTSYKQASGTGTIYSYSVMRRAKEPYAIAYVTLDGMGISMMTNIIDCDFDALEIGQSVKLKFSPTTSDDVRLPTFTPA